MIESHAIVEANYRYHHYQLLPEAAADALLQLDGELIPDWLRMQLSAFSRAERERLAEILKQKADQLMRTDIQHCFRVARFLMQIGQLWRDDLPVALGLRVEGNGRVIGLADYEQGIACYDEAAVIYARHGRLREQACSQIGKIYALASLGRYDEALETCEWAGLILSDLEEWFALAEVKMNLAIIHGRLGQDAPALTQFNQARDLYARSGEKGAAALHVVDINRAIVLRNLGRFDESIAANQDALAAHQRLGQKAAVARAQQNLAMTYFVLGRYNQALQLLQEAKTTFLEDGRYRHAMLVKLFISDCLLQLRRYNEALEICDRARRLFNKLGTGYEMGRSILNEANACLGLGREDEALAKLAEARALFVAEGNQTAVADTDLHTAAIFLQREQLVSAQMLTQMACEIFTEHDLPVGQIRAHLLAARIGLAMKQEVLAQTCIQRALRLAENQHLPSLTYQIHHLQGVLNAQQGRLADAFAAFAEGIDALEQLYGRLMLEYRADFAGDKNRLYEEMVALCLEMDRPETGLLYAERAKSSALRDLLAHRLNLSLEARSLDDEPLVADLHRLRAERDRLYRRWQTGEELGQREETAEQLAARQRVEHQVLDLEKEITQFWHQLQVRNADYAREAALWQIQAESVQSLLNDETLLLEFFSLDGQLVLFSVTTDGVEVVRLAANLSQVQQALQMLWLNLRAVPRTPEAGLPALTRNAQAILRKLYGQLLAPIQEKLGGFRQLLIVPHGPLHYLPFQALFNGRSYLIEHHEISYLPASTVLHYCQPAETAVSGMLAVGYSENGRLPHIAEELSAINHLWPSHTLLDEQADLATLKREMTGHQIIHLAAHGEFRPDNPLFSGLSLADGWLTTLDIFNLRLQASLVTLSACQTGRSVVGGGDELLGLMRAFLAAGAASLVASFWEVEDESTAELMRLFYKQLACGKTKTAALRQAQLNGLDRHPYFWAPFFLVGDTGRL